MILGELVVVHAEDHREVCTVAGRRNDDALGAGRKVCRCLFLAGEDAGALESDVDLHVLVRQFRRIALGRHLDRAAADVDRVTLDGDDLRELAMNRLGPARIAFLMLLLFVFAGTLSAAPKKSRKQSNAQRSAQQKQQALNNAIAMTKSRLQAAQQAYNALAAQTLKREAQAGGSTGGRTIWAFAINGALAAAAAMPPISARRDRLLLLSDLLIRCPHLNFVLGKKRPRIAPGPFRNTSPYSAAS